MYQNIPHEMREYRQWICWRYEVRDDGQPTKVPYNARSGWPASVIDPDHWSSFEEALRALDGGIYAGIGFVLTASDPFTFIDLDAPKDKQGNYIDDAQTYERQKHIHDTFNSYSEISPSGKGVHIIVKGNVQSGVRRGHVEVYSFGRYMTMTGNVYNNIPIQDRQGFLYILWSEMQKVYEVHNAQGTLEQKETDEVVIMRAKAAANGDKFSALYRGEWQNLYASQSEADFALIDIIAFYTQNRNQIRNIFLSSGLGQREKAKRVKYIDTMITRSFDRQIPPIDFEGLRNNIERQIEEMNAARALQSSAATGTRAAGEGAIQTPINALIGGARYVNGHAPEHVSGPELPPGLVGELARFLYAAAPRPVADIALMGAIGFMAGIVGRAYNVSGTGLNQYMLLLAKTGRGKEAMSSGIDKLIGSVRLAVPAMAQFIGPGDIASGQALIRYLNTSPSFVSIIGEFDKLLAAMSHTKANSAMIMLRKCILDMFGKSGFGQTYRPMIYSDSAKNTQTIASPSFTMLGECTPEKFYELLDENLISEGLLPRFMVIEFAGDRPPLNPDHQSVMPSTDLQQKLISVATCALTLMKGADGQFKVINIPTNNDARELMDEFDRFCDIQINTSNRDAVAQLWNRAHLKVLKLAGIIAVGVNPYSPVINREIAAWSMRFIERDVRNMLSRFEAGEIGSDEGKQLSEIRKIFAEYVTEPYERVGRYGVNRYLHAAHIVPMRYLTQRLASMACFRKDRMGPTFALKRSVGILLDQSEIAEFNREQLSQNFGTSGKAYMVKEMKI